MSFIINAYTALRVFSIASDVTKFKEWLKLEHGKVLSKKMLDGYKLFLETAFSSFYHGFAKDNTFKLSESFLFNRALGQTFYIEKLPVTGIDGCEKAVVLKNLYRQYVPIRKANRNEIENNLTHYKSTVHSKFLKLFGDLMTVKGKPSFEEAVNLLLIDQLYILYTQINNNGPTGYDATLFESYWIDNGRLKHALEGYKYTLQFLWHTVLGEETYRASSIINLHTSDTWRDYKTYNIARKNAKGFARIMGERFNIEEQTSLDSYFYRIREEIIYPLEKRYKRGISRFKDYFKVAKPKILSKRKVFGKLLSVTNAKASNAVLTVEEKIDMQLYWFSVEIMDGRKIQMHSGVPAFITALEGTVALRNSEKSSYKKVIVSKFISSIGKNKNDYSYGILIDSKAAAGHYYNGWLLFYDCCGDYSGFSGSEHRRAELMIKKHLKAGIIDLREMKVRKHDLKKYADQHLYSAPVTNKIDEKPDVSFKSTVAQGKYGELKGLTFELLCYYFAHNYYSDKGYKVTWGGVKKDSIDLELETVEKITVVECKINIDNYPWEKLMSSIQNRVSRKKQKPVDYEFWLWYESERHKNELAETGMEVKVFNSGRRDKLPFLDPVNLDKLKELFEYNF